MSEIEIFIKNPLRLDAEEWFEGTIEGYINYEMENFIDKNLKDKIQSLQSQLKAKVAAEATKDEIIKVLKESNEFYSDKLNYYDPYWKSDSPSNYKRVPHALIKSDLEDKENTIVGGKLARETKTKVADLEKGLEDE